MILQIKEIIKSNKKLEKITRILARPYFIYQNTKSDIVVWMKERGLFESIKSQWIKELKDSHKGERCFVVATGPSLTFDDLHAIKDEFSFAMNSCVLALDKTDWVPSIYGVQDEYVYKKIEDKILYESRRKLKNRIIVADVLANLCPSARIFPQFTHHYLDHKYNHLKTGEIKFSKDCSIVIYDDYSILFSLLQLAVYMGFKEIYLLGCDCTYNGKKKNFIEHGAIDPNCNNAGLRLIYVHSKFKDFAEENGIKVINCTRGGMLEEYPRMQLEKVINNLSSK